MTDRPGNVFFYNMSVSETDLMRSWVKRTLANKKIRVKFVIVKEFVGKELDTPTEIVKKEIVTQERTNIKY